MATPRRRGGPSRVITFHCSDDQRKDLAFTILHLSDLHRSPVEPISNDELISSLLADRDRAYAESPSIPPPDAIIITGDLIQGVGLEDPDSANKIDEQYCVAEKFLELLTAQLLGGDRSRLVVVPGNHDVDWNRAKSAMRLVEETEIPPNFSLLHCGANSELRWSWKERRVYKITNRELYEQRLLPFNQLVERFYDGVEITQAPLYRIHELADRRICVIAFDSCRGNDCFTLHGDIDEHALARAHLALLKSRPQLAIAAWHHNIEGLPAATDYMDPAIVAEMIGKGFRLGLHGHQHRAAAAHRYINLPNEERMAVVGAGSLCADKFHLPAGVNRQYNVIELSDDLSAARVHVREMVTAKVFAAARRSEFGLNTYIDLSWDPPPGFANGEARRTNEQVLDAERALHEKHFDKVPLILSGVSTDAGSYARTLLSTAFEELGQWDELTALLDQPGNTEELYKCTKAFAEAGELDQAGTFLDMHYENLGLKSQDVQDLRNFIAAKKALQ